MSEPILSREEVEALAHRICMKYVHSDDSNMRQYTFGMLTLERFAEAYQEALLEKLRGEPIYQIGDGNELWLDVEKGEFDLAHHARIVYILKGQS
ncbi:hypothetical protein WK62_05390 [Burkholderia ubonensis]|uniref:hypothetical protein n=1 Tax=Burkholderia ubonensis TaxID=101571 RepID=UPI00076C6AB1|nr:hypothetical protein [Burkholderia ubonensis]KVU10696.1 hypothetical protein WK62_05390 [Burkholderia ubonensis]